MPTISCFYGIIIRMRLGKNEHNPPHIHAYYQDDSAVFDLRTGEMTEGEMPNKQRKVVSAWVLLRQDELLADWELAQSGEEPYKIEPLK
ncbi:hypothetical protein FACS1894139_01230 [Planctomycetales bacterium]|nr:hypothetical protein FACS1894139_01230 [Planctomycetales bacterium]